MLNDCGQDVHISAVHVHACVFVFRGSKVAQVPAVVLFGESTAVTRLERMKIEEESIVLIVRHNYHHTSKQ